jgi:phospholipase C
VNVRFLLPFLLLCLAGCGGGSMSPGTGKPPKLGSTPPPGGSTTPFAHIVVVVQENRSFDNIFAASGGFPGANVAEQGLNSQGQEVPLQALGYELGLGPQHASKYLLQSWDTGKMDKFDLTPYEGNAPQPPFTTSNYQYAYLPKQETLPYWKLAAHYALADAMFSGALGPTFVGHQFLIAGIGPSDNPSGVWQCDGGNDDTVPLFDGEEVAPCFAYPTLATLLDAKGTSWKYYTGQPPPADPLDKFVNAFAAVNAVFNSSEFAAKVVPRSNFFSDVTNNALPAVSWITPNGDASDHDIFETGDKGPLWVGSIYEAIAQSPYYANTAIVVTWDDSGGWYDHVAPPDTLPIFPWSNYEGSTLGMRVPLLFLANDSVQAVSHQPHTFGSILAFVEANFGLGSLGTQDVGFGNLSEMYAPRPDSTIAPIPPATLLGSNAKAKLQRLLHEATIPADDE